MKMQKKSRAVRLAEAKFPKKNFLLPKGDAKAQKATMNRYAPMPKIAPTTKPVMDTDGDNE